MVLEVSEIIRLPAFSGMSRLSYHRVDTMIMVMDDDLHDSTTTVSRYYGDHHNG